LCEGRKEVRREKEREREGQREKERDSHERRQVSHFEVVSI
jgi:hypothetical protein